MIGWDLLIIQSQVWVSEASLLAFKKTHLLKPEGRNSWRWDTELKCNIGRTSENSWPRQVSYDNTGPREGKEWNLEIWDVDIWVDEFVNPVSSISLSPLGHQKWPSPFWKRDHPTFSKTVQKTQMRQVPNKTTNDLPQICSLLTARAPGPYGQISE